MVARISSLAFCELFTNHPQEFPLRRFFGICRDVGSTSPSLLPRDSCFIDLFCSRSSLFLLTWTFSRVRWLAWNGRCHKETREHTQASTTLAVHEAGMNETIQFLTQHGTLVLFAAVFAEQIGFPLPAVPFLIAAGALAGAGEMPLSLALGSA